MNVTELVIELSQKIKSLELDIDSKTYQLKRANEEIEELKAKIEEMKGF